MRSRLPSATQFPFRRDNRRRDGLWDAPDATEDNVKGSSIDPYEPVWPRWKQAPPHHGEGEFISDEPFFDIDEIAQRAEFYPPGTPLIDRNVDGNPPTLENALELGRQYITFIQERNFIFSGFPIFTGRSSTTAICMALKDIGAPSSPDCFDGWYGEPVDVVPWTSSNGP